MAGPTAGSVGGLRQLGRLTPELILHSPQYMNCVGQYELDLRGKRLSAIENLGATEVRRRAATTGLGTAVLSRRGAGSGDGGAGQDMAALWRREAGRFARGLAALSRQGTSPRAPGCFDRDRARPCAAGVGRFFISASPFASAWLFASFASSRLPLASSRRPLLLSSPSRSLFPLTSPFLRAVRARPQDQFESIDLSDNTIASLENFPKLTRLRVLHANSNLISRIRPNLSTALPSLEWLQLTNNRLTRLEDLLPLKSFAGTLTHLSLMENPVRALPEYRLFVVALLPRLKVLDFAKVTQAERLAARRRFPDGGTAEELSSEGVFEPGEGIPPPAQGAAPAANGGEAPAAQPAPAASADQLARIRAAIAAAGTLEEVQRLEEALATGEMPADIDED